eukprot:s50_g77.t1
MEEVLDRAQHFRLEQTQGAVAAQEVMGHPDKMVSPVEHELRVYVHDLIHAAHEKDFRSLSVFPIADLADALVVVLRADYRGGLVVETIQGRLWQKGGWVITVLIWKGHMTLLQAPEDVDVGTLLEAEDHVATPALGFEFFWHTRHDQTRTAPGKVLCRLCKSSRKAGEVDWMVRTQSCLAQVATVAGGLHQPVEVHRMVRPLEKGLVFQEIFAGTAGLTNEWKRTMEALEPLELFEHPHLKKGARPHHDLLRPEVEERMGKTMEAPDGANVYWIASPCTSYCDWQLQNGGTRTWEHPEGTGKGPLATTEALVVPSGGTSLFACPGDRQFPSGNGSTSESEDNVESAEDSGNGGEIARELVTGEEPHTMDQSIGPVAGVRLVSGGDSSAGAPRGPSDGCLPVSGGGSRASLLGGPGDGSQLEGGGDSRAALPVDHDAEVEGGHESARNRAGAEEFDRLWEESGAGDLSESDAGSDAESLPLPEGADAFFDEVCAVPLEIGEHLRPTVAGGEDCGDEPWSEDELEQAGEGLEESEEGSGWDEVPPGTMPRDEWVRTSGGRLILRHHRVKRRRLFVPDEADSQILEGNLEHRRTTYLTTQNGSSAVITDDWRMEGATNPGYGWWTGVTRFTLLEEEPVDEQPLDENDDGDEGSGGDDGGGPVMELDPHEEFHPLPKAGSSSSGVPRQMRGRGKDGGPEAGMRSAYAAPNPDARQAAQEYVEFLNQGFECNRSVAEAAKSLWEIREEKGLANLAGVGNQELDGKLHPDLLAYLGDVRTFGMAARYEGERARVPSKLHMDAKKHLDQVFKQVSKDVKKHRVLVVRSNHPNLSHTMCSPFETVQKLLPDRTVSTEKRLVHDQRMINLGTTKFLHPPAVQPTHTQIARRILWTKARNPNVPILMAKKDIAGAFRLLWVAPEDAELFGGDVPWKSEGFPDDAEWAGGDVLGVTVIYLVSSFGFSGSPGEWGVWGRATEEFHRAHCPEVTRRDLAIGFDSKVLVDDCILVEPQIGLRPWVSAEVFEDGVTQMLGAAAINRDKDVIEGEFRTVQTVWGVVMDTQAETAMLPERRIQKGAALVSDVNFDHGMKTLRLKDLQRFRGILTGWASILKGLDTELKAADVFLGGLDGEAKIRPKVRGEGTRQWEESRAWEDLWELFEVRPPWRVVEIHVRVLRCYPTMVGAIDWSSKKVCRLGVAKLKPWIKLVLTDEEQSETDGQLAIHLGEMLSFVAFACAVSEAWSGAVVVYGGDNVVVKNWLQTRRSSTRGGRLLIRVVNMVEMRTKCTVLAGWWRTYHNVDADYITRCTDEQYRSLEEVDIEGAIRQALEDSEMFGPCFLSWHDEGDRTTLMQLKERRMLRQLQRELTIPWASFEVEEWAQTDRRVRDFEQVARGLGASQFQDERKPRLLCASIGSDPMGGQLKRVLDRALKSGVWVTLVEGPRQAAWELGEARCKKEGWHFDVDEFVTTEMGELMARRRRVLLVQHEGEAVEWKTALIKMEVPPSGISSLKPASWSEEGSWVRPHRLEISGPVPRDPMLPRPVGHMWLEADQEREMVYNIAGPIRWPLMKPGTQEMEPVLVYDRRGPPNALRKLRPEELWKLQGRSFEEWKDRELSEIRPEARIVEGTKATGGATATSLLAVAGYVLLTLASRGTRAGMCRDEEGALALAQLLIWLRRWKRGELPRNEARRAGEARQETVFRWVEAWWCQYLGEDGDSEEEDDRYAGGRRQKTAQEVAAAVAVKVKDMSPRPFDGMVSTHIEEWVEDHLGGDKAVSTSRAYTSAWMKWEAWAKRQGWVSPFLSRKGDEVENENRVLNFLGYMGWLGASAATLRLSVFAIKDAHKRLRPTCIGSGC